MRRPTIMLGSMLAATAFTLSISAQPASAMPMNCLSLRVGYTQAEMAAQLADNTLLTFEQNAHPYYTPYYDRMVKGWFENFLGQVEHYDIPEAEWQQDQGAYQAAADLSNAEAEAAYDTYMETCGW
jgi:hypothetical protein